MDSDFVKNAKPQTTRSLSYLTWLHLCKIKAKKKTRQRRTLERRQITRATVVLDEVIHLKTLQEYPDNLVLGKFMETTWNGNHDGGKNHNDRRKRCPLMSSR